MEKLQWFKFSPSDYMMGKIQRCPEVTQARFVRLCCLYWNKECNLNIQDSVIEIDQEHFDILISKKIIKANEEHVFIDFLDEQMVEITETSKGKSKAARARWDKYKQQNSNTDAMQNDADAMHVHTDAMQNDAEKRRGEERREYNKVLLSEIEISDVPQKLLPYFEISKAFSNLFIKNSETLGVKWTHLDKTKFIKSVTPIRLLIESDKRSTEEIREVYKFLEKDSFWMQNIQTTEKLREKFDTLITQAKNSQKPQSNPVKNELDDYATNVMKQIEIAKSFHK
jgi:hypothetical protein